MNQYEAPHARIGSRVTFDLPDSKRGRCGRGLTGWVLGIARDVDHLSNGHRVRRDLRVGGLQIVDGDAELESNAADGVSRLNRVHERRRAGKGRFLDDDRRFPSLARA